MVPSSAIAAVEKLKATAPKNPKTGIALQACY